LQRSDALIKFISVIVFLTLVVYMGYAFYVQQDDSLKTVLAVDMELREGIQTVGYAVRDEEQLKNSSGSISVTVSEGEKVAKGAEIAVTYSGTSALKREESIRELNIQIQQLEAMKSSTSETESAKNSILSLSKAVAGRDLSGLDAILLDINTYITDGDSSVDTANIDSTLESLKSQLNSLMVARNGTSVVSADMSGTFSYFVDGFEYISSDMVTDGLMPEDVESLFSSPESVSSNVFGKLVSGIKWYYITVMDTQSASRISGSSSVNVAFSKTYSNTISMKVEKVGAVDSDGNCVVLLSSTKYIQDVVSIRDMTGEIVLSATTGVQVPREGMHIDDDGQTYVYILKGLRAERVDVNILGESGDFYMVEATSSGLRSGDEIITQASNLYDGAVVAK
jgi:hypothetical protein